MTPNEILYLLLGIILGVDALMTIMVLIHDKRGR